MKRRIFLKKIGPKRISFDEGVSKIRTGPFFLGHPLYMEKLVQDKILAEKDLAISEKNLAISEKNLAISEKNLAIGQMEFYKRTNAILHEHLNKK